MFRTICTLSTVPFAGLLLGLVKHSDWDGLIRMYNRFPTFVQKFEVVVMAMKLGRHRAQQAGAWDGIAHKWPTVPHIDEVELEIPEN